MKGILAAITTVLAGFFGVRSRKNAEQAPIKMLHLIIAGLFCALLLVVLLLIVVRYVVMSGGGL